MQSSKLCLNWRLTILGLSLVVLVVAILLTSGCAKKLQHDSGISSSKINKQQELAQAQDLLNKANREGIEQVRQNYKLQAAERYIRAENYRQAERLLAELINLNHEQAAFHNVLLSEIKLNSQEPYQALELLQYIWHIESLPVDLQAKLFKLRATTHARLGNNLSAAKDYISLHDFLSEQEQPANLQTIRNMLNQLSPQQLHGAISKQNNDALNGWLGFAYLSKQYDNDQAQTVRALTLWKQRYPQHPANQIFTNYSRLSVPNLNIEPTQPKKIALLLPLSGTYATNAESIKNGFLSAYYQHAQASGISAEIKIYDTVTSTSSGTGNQSGVITAYNNAVTDKVDFIVGPLVKEDVEKLAKHASAVVPILTLNTILTTAATSNLSVPKNFYQFGLPPEDETIALAEQAKQNGHRRALIIIPDNEVGQRISKAFQTSWQADNLQTVAIVKVSEQSNLNTSIKKVLGIEASEQRANSLKRIGIKARSEPRRRQDIDMVFLATNPVLARQIKPLLNFYYAKEIPVYAISSVYTGRPQANRDQDLNGIKFCDMPWVLDQTITARSLYQTIADLWPTQLEQNPRLFALGIDAYKLTSQLQQLAMMPELGISGMTGVLTLTHKQQIQRKFMWASFRNGLPVIYN